MEHKELSESLPLKTSADGKELSTSSDDLVNLLYSSDIDPDLNTVIQWHISLCAECNPDKPNATFGVAASNYCPEYWEIISDYADYEVKYAWNGNP